MTFALLKLIVAKVVNIQRVYAVKKKSPISYRALINVRFAAYYIL